jgi:hypothetical protein
VSLDRGPTPFANLAEVKKANANSGRFWFSPATLEYFHCRVETGLIRGRYFITSECREPEPYRDVRGREQEATERRYTVRYAQDDAAIETIGEFMQYGSCAEALTALLEHDQQQEP